MALTIYDISQKAGVSIATVSRVLNGSDKVRPATREKIMEIIEQYDYSPNAFARGMTLQSSKTIGILCTDSSDLFFAKAIHYLEQELQAHGYESLLCSTGYNTHIRKTYIDLILSKKIDGLILVGSNFIGTTEEENHYIKEASEQIPVAILNGVFDYPNVYSVLCDDYTNTMEATSTMLKAGIKNILYLYDSKAYSAIRKLDGFKAAMQQHISNYENLIYFFDKKTDKFRDVASFIENIAKKHTFHGIITSNDFLAIGGIKYAQQNGLQIPKDLSIIGYNNSMLTGCCTPELSSIDNRLEMQCHQLILILLQALSGEKPLSKTMISGTLIQRGTTIF